MITRKMRTAAGDRVSPAHRRARARPSTPARAVTITKSMDLTRSISRWYGVAVTVSCVLSGPGVHGLITATCSEPAFRQRVVRRLDVHPGSGSAGDGSGMRLRPGELAWPDRTGKHSRRPVLLRSAGPAMVRTSGPRRTCRMRAARSAGDSDRQAGRSTLRAGHLAGAGPRTRMREPGRRTGRQAGPCGPACRPQLVLGASGFALLDGLGPAAVALHASTIRAVFTSLDWGAATRSQPPPRDRASHRALAAGN